MISALDPWDGAEGAQLVAAVGDLDVRVGATQAGSPLARYAATQQPRQLPLIGAAREPEPARHLGDALPQLLSIPFHQAAHYQDLLPRIRRRGVEDGRYRLFLGLTDEAARVEKDVGGVRGLGDDLDTRLTQRPRDSPAVGLVLWTPESVHIQPRATSRRRTHATRWSRSCWTPAAPRPLRSQERSRPRRSGSKACC